MNGHRKWNRRYKTYCTYSKQTAFLLLVVLCVSCSGGADGPVDLGSQQGLHVVTTRHENGALASRGDVSTDNQRQGAWDWYYDNQQPRLHAVFKDGVMQSESDWSLYNKDGSTRANHSDGGYVFPKFWH